MSAKLRAAQPQLFVRDMKRAVAFYRDRLGFDVAFSYGEPPFYALVRRDAAALNLRHVDDPVWDEAVRGKEDLLSASIPARGLGALYAEVERGGVDLHQPLREQPWGRDFIVRDPDGNLIHFMAADADAG